MRNSITPIHFISAHRAGTATLSTFFSNCNDVKSEHQRQRHLYMNIVGNLYQRGLVSDRLFHFAVNQLNVKWFKSNLGQKAVIETNGFNIFALPVVKKQLPNLKIIHIIRDPMRFATSMHQKRTTNPLKHKLQLTIPFWQPKPTKSILNKLQLKKMNETELLLWQWAAKNEFLHDNFHGSADYKIVKFEKLFSGSGGEEFKKIIEFCGLKYLGLKHENLLNIKLNATNSDIFPVNNEKINIENCQNRLITYIETVKNKFDI